MKLWRRKYAPPPKKKKTSSGDSVFCFKTFDGKNYFHIIWIRKNIDKKVDIPINISSPW